MTLAKFAHQVPSYFDRFSENDLFDWSTRNYSTTNTSIPNVNIKEDNTSYEVEMAVPGFEKKDFNIELKNNLITISSERKSEKEIREGQQFNRREFSYQSFCRSFTLPDIAETERISAKYDNGILKMAIPKKEEARKKSTKRIEIK